MSNIELQPFCGTDECRPYLMKPFSFGDFTYATNGHVMVRIPRRTDVPEQTQKGKWEAPLVGIDAATFSKPHFNLPSAPEADDECEACEGSGKGHPTCPDCECECIDCGGTGHDIPERTISTEFNGVKFALRYMRQILALPGIELATTEDAAALMFRFDGGVGAVMPLRGELAQHVKIFKVNLPAAPEGK